MEILSHGFPPRTSLKFWTVLATVFFSFSLRFQAVQTFWYTYKTVGSGPNTKYSDELAEVLVATGTGKRAPANLGDFTTLETFVTDDDGNTVSRTTTAGTVSYEWDDFNNLLSVQLENGETTQNSYDAGSIREEMVKDSGEKVQSFYSGLPTATETSTLNGNTSYFLGHQLLGYEKNGNCLYYITDGLSTVRAVLDSNGNEVSTFNSDEYGNQLNATGTSPKTWVGGLGVHNDTADTRLLYMRRRHYDPKLGRFLSQDPIRLSGGLNLYSYGGNSPVRFVDPSGFKPILGPDARRVLGPEYVEAFNQGIEQARARWKHFKQEPFKAIPDGMKPEDATECELPFDYEDFLNGDDDITFELAPESYFLEVWSLDPKSSAAMVADPNGKTIWIREKNAIADPYDLGQKILHEPTHSMLFRKDRSYNTKAPGYAHPDKQFKFGVDAIPFDNSWRF